MCTRMDVTTPRLLNENQAYSEQLRNELLLSTLGEQSAKEGAGFTLVTGTARARGPKDPTALACERRAERPDSG